MKQENHPVCYSTEISDSAERALQRAIILSSVSNLNGKEVEWLDIEIPVDYSGKPRGKSIDLIGKDADGKYVLCEVKFRKKSSDNDNPEEAAKQLKRYHELIKENYDKIHGHKENGKAVDWKEVASDRTRLVVAANNSYWENWDEKSINGWKFDTSNVELYSIAVDEFEFEKQKGNAKKYTPNMPSEAKTWSLIEK